MSRVSHRRITVGICFLGWLGAAALVCGLFSPDRLTSERQQAFTDPTAVVRAQAKKPLIAPAISLADR